LRAKRLNHWYAFLDSPARFGFSLFFLFVFWNSSDSPLLAIKAHFYGVLLLMVFSLVLAIRNLGRISFASTQSSWRFLSEASPMMWTGAIIIFLGWTDTFILGIFESDDVVGVYFVVLKIAMLAGFSLEAINSILMPQMAKYYLEKESQQYKKVVLFATQLNFFITLGVIVFLLVFHKWILGLFGKEFIVGSTVLLILLGGQLIISFAGFSGMILLMTGHQKIYRNITGFCLLLNILLNLILTPLYGYVGTGIATVVSLVSLNLSSAIFIKRKLGFESWFNPFLFIKKVK
jgi:O-antigen/teichoic acid export membrane protein